VLSRASSIRTISKLDSFVQASDEVNNIFSSFLQTITDIESVLAVVLGFGKKANSKHLNNKKAE
jgi:hypothetical protein